MDRVRVDRSDPGAAVVVLREGIGPWNVAARRWPGQVLIAVFAAALCGFPVYMVMVMYEFGPGAVRAAVGIAALLGFLHHTGTTVYAAFRDVHRLRFSPATAPDTLTLVRATRSDPPRRLASVHRVWIEDYL